MEIRELGVEGAFEVTPRQLGGGQSLFLESFRGDLLAERIGHRPAIVQSNLSVNGRGTVRGIHWADVPPSQAKYVTCLSGSLVDYVIDVRVGSPTFGRWDSVVLDTKDRRAVYVPEGMGHAFAALDDHTTVLYLVTSTYNPGGEHGIHPLDPDVGLRLPEGMSAPILSEKDAAAPTLAEAREQGLLPTYAACQEFYASLG